MKCLLAASGLKVIRDVADDRLTIVSVMEQISPEAFPAFLPKIASVFVFRQESGDPEQLQCDFRIALGEVEIVRGPLSIDFRGATRSRQIINIEGLLIPGAGVLRASVSIEDQELGGWSVEVVAPSSFPEVIPEGSSGTEVSA